MVVLVHTSQMYDIPSVIKRISEFGQMGCQLFLVISGFTLMSSWKKRKLSINKFYANRWLSLAPGYWIAIVIYFAFNVVKTYVGKGMTISSFSIGALINATLLHGFVPQYNNNIVPGGWYVGTTVIIYMLFPFIVKAMCSDTSRKYKILQSYILPIVMSFVFVLILLGVKTIGLNVDLSNNTFLYFSVFNQLPCAVCGIILSNRYDTDKTNKNNLLLLVAIALFVMSYLLFHSMFDYRYYVVPILSSLSYSCLIEWLLNHDRINGAKWLCFIGKESFGIYLIHPLFAYQLSSVIKRIVHMDNVWLFIMMYAVIMALSLLFGRIVITRFVNRIKIFKFSGN